jgi:hypothetical protein
MTHCPQRELTGYLRFNLSHCVQSLILSCNFCRRYCLRIIGTMQSDQIPISAEESYPRHRQPPSAHLQSRPGALRRCINDKDTPNVPRQEPVLYPERRLVADADIFSSITIERVSQSALEPAALVAFHVRSIARSGDVYSEARPKHKTRCQPYRATATASSSPAAWAWARSSEKVSGRSLFRM